MLIREFWKIPFLRFILPFIIGILLADSFEFNQIFLLSFTILFFCLSFIYHPFLNHDQSYHQRWIFGVIISIALLFTGSFLATNHLTVDRQIIDAQKVVGVVDGPAKETEKSIKLKLKVVEYQKNNVWKTDNSIILVYIEKDSLAKLLKYGDLILLEAHLDEIKNPGNPNEFDYKTYYIRKGIYYQTYQNNSQWIKIDSNKGNPVYSLAYFIRQKLLETYKKAGLKGDEFAFLAALTIGVKDYLSDEIIEDYSDSGAMHILAVSGLHVGIITMILGVILYPIRRNRKLIAIYTIVIIVAIWFFAVITGLAPSVTRASLMFSFYLTGRNSGRKPSAYNSIAASAFIILIFNPLAIYDVGFQLSYFALLSILFFQPRIYRQIDIRNGLIDKLWQLTTVSIAAQIGTTPISIFYFHQFPVYALITNIIAIPGAFVCMCGAILLTLSSIYQPFCELISKLLSIVIQTLNSVIGFIEGIPFSSIEFISLSKLEMFLLYFAIGLCLLLIYTKKGKIAIIICISLVLSFGLRDLRFLQNINSKQFIVFNTRGKSAFAEISSNKMNLFVDSIILKDRRSVDYIRSNIITEYFIKQCITRNSEIQSNDSVYKYPFRYFQVDTLKVVYLINDLSYYTTSKKLEINYLIINKNISLNLDVFKSLFKFQLLIFDSSVPKWKQNILKKDCEESRIPYYNVSEQGAFVWSSTN